MSGTTEPPTRIPFGPFEADLPSQELRKHGVRLRLPRQSFQILKMLLERPGELVTREELRAALWPADTFVDFEHSLNAAINKLRETLGDDADNPHYIETLPRRGYRFICPKVPGTIQPEQANPPQPPPVSPPRHWVFPLSAGALIALTLVVIALAISGLRGKLLFHSAAQPQVRSLAVLPLANLSGDPQQEYFADAMTDELIAELSRISSLKVISHTSVMQYQGEKKKPIPQIGRELRADAIMEGTVLRSGNRVRIAAQLIYAPTDQHLMAETYESDLGDVLKLQREVAEAITQKVKLKLTPGEKAHLRSAPEVNPEAYQDYLAAHSFDLSRYQGIKNSQSHLERAIAKDPDFAAAYVALAWANIGLGEFRWQSPRDAFPPAKQVLGKALKLDEKNCDAHMALWELAWRYDWDWTTAETELRNALELCPNSAGAHLSYAYYAGWGGRGAMAFAELAKARELNVLCPCLLQVEALIDYHLRNYKAMIEPARGQLASNENGWITHYLLGVGYEGSGRTAEAIPEYQKAIELSQGDEDPTAALAHAYAATGKRAQAQKILHELLNRSEINYISPYMVATIYASLSDKDKAFEYLEKAYQEKSSDLPYFLRADLRIDNLRSDARFQDLLRRMNFPQQVGQ